MHSMATPNLPARSMRRRPSLDELRDAVRELRQQIREDNRDRDARLLAVEKGLAHVQGAKANVAAGEAAAG